MRKYATSWLIKVLLGAIVVVFVLWGVGSYKSQKESRVAVVNGETITIEEFKSAYTAMVEQLRRQFGNSLNDELLKAFQVKQRVVNDIIDKRILLAEAERLNFRVTDAELSQTIRNFGAFQSNGMFDANLYQRLLSLNRLTPEEFEAQQREAMLMTKLRAYIEGNIKVSEAEVMEWYNWQNLSVNISYVLFDPETYEAAQPSIDDIQTFYDKRKSDYKLDPEINVRYVAFKPEAYRHQVNVAEEDLKSYYEANPELYRLPKTVEARHILFRVKADADEAAAEATRSRAMEVIGMARAGEDFADLAKRYSEGPTGEQGGYLGTFKKEDMVEPFAEKAFSMKAGEISEPVRTRFGWHLIKIDSVNEAKQLSYDEARESINMKLAEEKARFLAYDDAEAVFDASYEGGKLTGAGAANREMKTTGFFSRRGFEDKDIKVPERFVEAAFKLELDEISDVLDLGEGYYILQVIEKKPERIPAVEEVRERIVADLKKERREKKAQKDADAFLASLKQDSIEKAADQKSLVLEHSGYFKRNDPIPGIGSEQGISAAAFELSEKKPLPDKVVGSSKGFYVICYKGKKKPDQNAYEQNREKTGKELLGRKKTRAFNEWMTKLRDSSTIEIAEGYRG